MNIRDLSGRAARFFRFLPADDWQVLALLIVCKVVLFFYGVQAYVALANQRTGGFRAALEIWNRWDSLLYLEIAEHGYRAVGDSINRLVLFPLYPWLVRLAAFFTRDYFTGGLIVSAIALLAAGVALRRLVELDEQPSTAQRAVWFLAIFPTAFFLHIAYAEALFLALTLGAFLAARKERWVVAGLLGAAATLTRMNGILLAAALLPELFFQWRAKRQWEWRWLALLLLPLALGLFLWINDRVGGSPFRFAQIQHEHFFKQFTWPWVGIAAKVRHFSVNPARDAVLVGTQEMIFILLGLAATIGSWFTLRLSYSVWMTLNWLVFTSAGYLLCTPRYTLALFPLFILFARRARHPVWYAAITIWSLLFLALYVGIFVQGWWIS